MNNNYNKQDRGYLWVLLEPDELTLQTMMQKLQISELFARILINRGITDLETASTSINPKLRHLLPNPFILKDIGIATTRVIDAINSREKITIFADYDVDGATSSAILYRYLKQLGIESQIYVPDRLKEGYGPNSQALTTIKKQGTSLVVTVDCGTTAFQPLEHARNIGLDVIVIDHHLQAETLPPAIAVINPNRLDDDFPIKKIAAVAVTYLFIIALHNTLIQQHWFIQHNIPEPDLMQFLDLVGLGTVCDVIPLDPLNRAFVRHGLRLLRQRNNVGLASLMDILRIDNKIEVYHLGYVIGPRINGGGRCDNSSLGARLLTTDDPLEAMSIARKLDEINQERKTIENIALEEAITQIESVPKNSHLVVAVGQNWHLGILGILASRLKERYHKPAIIMTMLDDTTAKGSGRSITGFDLGATINEAKENDLLLDGGGHPMAGGFTVAKDKIEPFAEYIEKKLVNCEQIYISAKELYIDAFIHLQHFNQDLLKEINLLSPFGAGNRQPHILVYARIAKIIPMRHPSIAVILEDGNYNGIRAVSFRGRESSIGEILEKNAGKMVYIVGTIQKNPISEGLNIIIEDVSTDITTMITRKI